MEYPPKPTTTFRQIDPGPRARRQKRLCCSTLLGRAFLLVLFLSLAWFLYRPIRGLLGLIYSVPHTTLYQDKSKPYQPQDVVRPLIDSNQTFDIVATVWLRAVNDSGSTDVLKLNEKAIFSDTIFRGLRLKDKSKTSVKFTVSTEVFKRSELNNYDLRASFVLVPRSPSPLESAINFTKWRPDSANYPPVRSWLDPDRRSLADEIIDSYGTFIPLLSFNRIQSRCPNPIDSLEDDQSEDEKVDEPPTNPSYFLDESKESYSSTEGKPVLQSHPYIVTRSYLRVVDVTELYNREAYDEQHEKLKRTACALPYSPADWRLCERSFAYNGNQEVQIQLLRKNDESGDNRREYAYAPYLSISRKAWGPLDLVPVPVNRQNCSEVESTASQSADSDTVVPDEEFVFITWNIAFSGRTPRKLRIADWAGLVIPPIDSLNMTDTDVHKPIQWLVEHADSVAGNQHRDDYHPRRVLILTALRFIFSILSNILAILYWYTRSSTVGLSISGIKFISLGNIFHFLSIFLVTLLNSQLSVKHILFLCAWNILFLTKPLLMLKAATRAEVYKYKRWVPAVRFAPETHEERSSQRFEARTSWRVKIMIYTVLAIIFSIGYYQDAYVFKPVNPRTSPRNSTMRNLDVVETLTMEPAFITGWILQIVLNFRMKRFAGMYSLGAYFGALAWLFQFSDNSKKITGTSWTTSGVQYFDLAEGVCCAILVGQALIYQKISHVDVDEDNQ